MGKPVEDIGPKERYQHNVDFRVEGNSESHVRILNQTPISRYFRRGLIDRRQFDAAETMWRDHYQAGQEPRVVIDLTRISRAQTDDMPARIIDARARLGKAYAALGQLGTPVIQFVVLDHKSAADWAHWKGIGTGKSAEKIGMALLRMALTILADHYEKDSSGRWMR